MKIEIGQKYQHYKTRDIYIIINIATMQAHLESGLDMCECLIYKKEGDEKVWVRPVNMFLEKVILDDGQKVSRFMRV
jgi:hypothetical protein